MIWFHDGILTGSSLIYEGQDTCFEGHREAWHVRVPIELFYYYTYTIIYNICNYSAVMYRIFSDLLHHSPAFP